MFNRSKGSNSPPVSTVTPIDEDEQSKIADEIKQQAAAQSQTLRTIFHYIFLVVVLILFICLLYSLFSPWEMQHQQVFQGIVPIYGFFAYYGGSMYCYGISAMIVKTNVRVSALLLNTAYFVCALSIVMWGVVFCSYGVNNPVLFWLPLGNIAGILLAHYVEKDTNEMVTSAEGLEQYKYSFKGV